MSLLLVALVFSVAAGGFGFFYGRQGIRPSWWWYVLAAVFTGLIGALFLVGGVAGWYPEGGDAQVQRCWDGTGWGRRIRWSGTGWEPA